jgi:hypothetical protein
MMSVRKLLCTPLPYLALLLAAFPVIALGSSAAARADGGPPVEYNRDVLPILAENCFNCHGPDAAAVGAGLRLDQFAGATAERGGGRRPIVPGNRRESQVVRRIHGEGGPLMPPPHSNKSLTGDQKRLLERWIAQGAAYQAHWAFVAPERPELPRVRNRRWERNPIDRFILARLERERLRPSPEADKATLLRRVTLDLTGLPPTPAELKAFLADRSRDAYEKVVDRLLSSPRYGERMVWEWLDAARYADTNGYQGDRTRNMWPWRDWVIRALNENMPFDQFTVEQLAGDLLPNPTQDQRIATGFNRNHMLNGEGGRIAEESRVDYVVDRVDTTSTVWLGLTVGCARCHDHKYDPVSQQEYYQLYAYFNNLPETGGVDYHGSARPVLPLPTPEQKERLETLRKSIAELEEQVKEAPEDQREALQKQLEEARTAHRQTEERVVAVMVMEERPEPRETFLLKRGAYDQYGDRVTPDVLDCLPPLPEGAPANRLALAQWLVDPAHPLTARVTVNRYWQTFFGTGLVKTSEDFGVQGEPPSHPELLDWLAREFVESGWNVKAMHRLLVTSAAYRQASKSTAALRERDPENRLLARGPRHRLPSWMLRDQALSLSGLLVEKQGGPPVKTYQPPSVWEDATFGQIKFEPDSGESLYRRSLYTFWRRIVGPTNLFDTPARQTCVVRQDQTNSPLHALTLMNDVTYVEAARAFAQRLLQQADLTPEARVETAFREAVLRAPRRDERQILLAALERLRGHYAAAEEEAKQLLAVGESPRDETLDPVEHAAFTGLCNLILNLDEVISKE